MPVEKDTDNSRNEQVPQIKRIIITEKGLLFLLNDSIGKVIVFLWMIGIQNMAIIILLCFLLHG